MFWTDYIEELRKIQVISIKSWLNIRGDTVPGLPLAQLIFVTRGAT